MWKFFRLLTISLSSLVCIMSLFALCAFLFEKSGYHFGTELGRWRYATETRYFALTSIEAFLSIFVLFLSFKYRSHYSLLIVMCVLLLIVISFFVL